MTLDTSTGKIKVDLIFTFMRCVLHKMIKRMKHTKGIA